MQLKVIIHRKGNSLNYTIHVNKESGVTHDVNLTMLPSKWRVFFSPSMEFAEIQSFKAARPKSRIETMDKDAIYMYLFLMELFRECT